MGDGDAWEEVRADGVYSIQLEVEELSAQETGTGSWFVPSARLHPWAATNPDAGDTPGAADKTPTVTSAKHTFGRTEDEREASDSQTGGHTAEVSPVYLGFLTKLRESIRRRVSTIPLHSSHASKYGMCNARMDSFHPLPGEDMNAAEASSSIAVGHGGFGVLDNIPARVGVLFSGGLDSVVIAVMLAD